MSNSSIPDRATGALMGAFIGDALALGPHWYYSLRELRRDYGDWIDEYTDPKPGRYHDGMKVSIVYGMPCAIYHQLPAAYCLAARFHDDFESAVLHAVNGGGQKQVRAILAGALAGAQTGLAGIPQRFIDGLEKSTVLLQLTDKMASQIEST